MNRGGPSQFFLTLPSNSSFRYFPDNTLTEFNTYLPQYFDLQGEWEVGLAEIQYPRSWANVKKGCWFRIHQNVKNDIDIPLPAGYYANAESLLATMNQELEPVTKSIQLTYSRVSKRTTVTFVAKNANLKMTLNERLGQLLGFGGSVELTETTISPHAVDMEMGFHSIFVYCDIVESSVVGDNCVPLLRVVQTIGKDGGQVTLSYDQPRYIRLLRHQFRTINLILRDDEGEPVPFETGRVTVTLHFRRAPL